MQRRMLADGMNRQQAVEMSGKLEEQCRERALQTTRIEFLTRSIAKKESIALEEKELDEKIIEICNSSPDLERSVRFFEDEANRENLRQELLYNKVFDFIEKNSNIKIANDITVTTEEESK